MPDSPIEKDSAMTPITQLTDLRALTPGQYSRFQEAAKQRAHALRQEAMAQFWGDAGRWIARRFSTPAALRKGKPVEPSLA
jgi:hypothetical protein